MRAHVCERARRVPVRGRPAPLTSRPTASVRSDDNAGIRPKMLYASSKDAIKKSLNGVQEEYQATERGDLDETEVNKKAGGNK